jgi:peroxiredoxin
MTIQVGDRIPDVNLTLATPEGPIPVKSGDYFAGKRSQRYSMIVNDGVVEQVNVEAPGEYSASSAETMLGQL